MKPHLLLMIHISKSKVESNPKREGRGAVTQVKKKMLLHVSSYLYFVIVFVFVFVLVFVFVFVFGILENIFGILDHPCLHFG